MLHVAKRGVLMLISRVLKGLVLIGIVLATLAPSKAQALNQVCWFEERSRVTDDGQGNITVSVTAEEKCFDLDSLSGNGTGGFFDGVGGGPEVGSDSVIGERTQQEETDPCKKANPTTPRPVIIASGVKIKPEIDFNSGGYASLGMARLYVQSQQKSGLFGAKWSSNIEYTLSFVYSESVRCDGKFAGNTSCGSGGLPLQEVLAYRASGFPMTFKPNSSGQWIDGNGAELSQVGSNWQITQNSGAVDIYDSQGRPLTIKDERGIGLTYAYSNGVLSSVTHTSGKVMGFGWTGGRLTAITNSAAKTFIYGYNASGLLTSVTYPDSLGVRSYHYENAQLPGALTGISINGARYSKYTYHPDGRVLKSGLGINGDIDSSTFAYGADYVNVTNAAGQTIHYEIAEVGGRRTIIGVERPASETCPAGGVYTAYGSDGNIDYTLDAYGVKTDLTYDAFDRVTQKISGIGSSGQQDQQQITQFVWDPVYRERLVSLKVFGNSLSAPVKETIYDYYPDSHPAARLIRYVTEVNRSPVGLANQAKVVSFGYSFHTNGIPSAIVIDGPLSGTGDQITYLYDTAGNLTSVSNSLSHTNTFSNYNGLGQPGRVTGANGDIIDRTYDALGRVTSKKSLGGTRNATTTYQYDANGNVSRIIEPTGKITDYGYTIKGDLGYAVTSRPATSGEFSEDGRIYASQSIIYGVHGRPTYIQLARHWYEYVQTCNPECGPIGPEDPGGSMQMMMQVTATKAISYDQAGFISAETGNSGQNYRYQYDANGNPSAFTDSLGRTTVVQYDRHQREALYRDPTGAETLLQYDALGRVISVTDPRGPVTAYSYDGLGQLWMTSSPDTGSTTYTYAEPGLPATQTKADGTGLVYQYDTLGRLTWYGTSAEGRSYGYDTCVNGKGRLCGTNTNVAGGLITNFSYEPQGEVVGQQDWTPSSNLNTVRYYDSVGQQTALQYPDGTSVGYGYLEGHPTAMTVNVAGVVSNVVTNAAYEPFGGLSAMTFGNGLWKNASFDLDGRLTELTTSITWNSVIQRLTYQYNANNDVTKVSNVAMSSAYDYEYDLAGRLTKEGIASNNYRSYGYDLSGNRSVESGAIPGVMIPPVYYVSEPSKNRLQSYGGVSYTNSATGDRTSAHRPGVYAHNYLYDSFKRVSGVDAWNGSGYSSIASYGYNALDQRVVKTAGSETTRFVYGGRNELLSEYKSGTWTHYLWFGGEVVGFVRSGQKYYVHADHQGRPEVVTNSAKAVVWRAANSAFSRAVTVDSVGGLNVGLPGQYFDAESGLWNNGYRTYDSETGRYLQADPVGLGGGINLYSYVGGSPLRRTDSLGLRPLCDCEKQALERYKGYVDLDSIRFVPDFGVLPEGTDAMTIGNTILHNSGVDSPGSEDTIVLLGHELEHVFQQTVWRGNFLSSYLGQYLQGRNSGMSDNAAYRSIGFEEQARGGESLVKQDLDKYGNPCDG